MVSLRICFGLDGCAEFHLVESEWSREKVTTGRSSQINHSLMEKKCILFLQVMSSKLK